MSVLGRSPYWIRGCLAGAVIGAVLFVGFVALFTLTPLHFVVVAFTASVAIGAETFREIALPTALLGAWVGGLFGMPVGALVGRASARSEPVWSVPGWLTGGIVTAYVILPTFVDPTTTMASDPLPTRVLVYAIMIGLGALVGYILGGIRRLIRRLGARFGLGAAARARR
jgi:hypothetical protein